MKNAWFQMYDLAIRGPTLWNENFYVAGNPDNDDNDNNNDKYKYNHQSCHQVPYHLEKNN